MKQIKIKKVKKIFKNTKKYYTFTKNYENKKGSGKKSHLTNKCGEKSH